ncbi:MAG: glycosyltransferase family 39 protein [Planctomycetaceae bacterium]|jgi:4-amino-4-deoxy-L-arabinose transferase-like glycosyltransferase|nr:glycosyltransferase family 39 protein [Planctomycetaceae bacterium]
MSKLTELFRAYPNRFFCVVGIVYSLIWFLLPFLTLANVRPDTIEQFFVGKEWVIGTTKSATLPAWMLEIALTLTGGAAWSTYLVSSLAIFVMLCCIWKLSREFLPPHLALLAVLAACNFRYLNIGAIYFHQNESVLSFCALTVLCFYYAIKTGKRRYWILLGITIGLGMLCFYLMGMLAFTIFLFVVGFKETRKYWWKLGITIIVSFLIFTPHLLWNINHGFPGIIRAATFSDSENPQWYFHIRNPFFFIVSQFALLAPMLISICPAIGLRKLSVISNNTLPDILAKWFLPFIVFVPILLILVYLICTGNGVRSRFGAPFWLFFPLFMLYCFHLSPDTKKLKQAFCYTFVVMFATMAIFVGYWIIEPLVGDKPNDTLFPGRALATEVERIWHEKYSTPIPYAAGEWMLSGNLALYGKDRPTVLAYDGNASFAANEESLILLCITKEDLYKKGAVILWQIRDENNPIHPKLETDYPNAKPLDIVITVPYLSTIRKFPPLKVGMAIIPPPELSDEGKYTEHD